MNRNKIPKIRAERLELWRACVGGPYGLVDQVTAAWLLNISKQRINCLVALGRLESTRKINQHLLISFASVERFAKGESRENRRATSTGSALKPIEKNGETR